jgi:hypothetical protein
VRAGDEYVRLGDRGDAIDPVEAADDEQQDRREDDQPVTLPRGARPWLAWFLQKSL